MGEGKDWPRLSSRKGVRWPRAGAKREARSRAEERGIQVPSIESPPEATLKVLEMSRRVEVRSEGEVNVGRRSVVPLT